MDDEKKEFWKEYKKEKTAEKQERHRGWKKKNMEILSGSGVPFQRTSEECCCFRKGPHKADFYPSTGRWRNLVTGKTHRGGATAFLKWWEKI